jgi:hypothetical protein
LRASFVLRWTLHGVAFATVSAIWFVGRNWSQPTAVAADLNDDPRIIGSLLGDHALPLGCLIKGRIRRKIITNTQFRF